MNSYNKQQTVRLLPIAFDVAEIINSFLFYDFETLTKTRKKQIVDVIDNAYCSRKRPKNMICMNRNPDTCEVWTFSLEHIYQHGGLLIQAISCRTCGEYKFTNTEIPNKIECKCNL